MIHAKEVELVELLVVRGPKNYVFMHQLVGQITVNLVRTEVNVKVWAVCGVRANVFKHKEL